MAVSVEDRELVGEDALAGHGEWGSVLTWAGGAVFSCPFCTVPSTGPLAL